MTVLLADPPSACLEKTGGGQRAPQSPSRHQISALSSWRHPGPQEGAEKGVEQTFTADLQQCWPLLSFLPGNLSEGSETKREIAGMRIRQ